MCEHEDSYFLPLGLGRYCPACAHHWPEVPTEGEVELEVAGEGE